MSSRLLRDLANFLYLSKRYQKPVLYNWYNISQTAKKTGLNRAVIRKYVKRFLDRGWCKMDDGHLYFLHPNKIIQTEKSHQLKVELHDNVDQIMDQLRILVLKRTRDQFEWAKKLRKNKQQREEFCNEQDLIDAGFDDPGFTPMKRTILKRIIDVYESCHFFLSIKKIASLFGCSPGMAHRTMTRLAQAGLIKIFKKERGFLKKREDRFYETRMEREDNPDIYFEGKPCKANWCDFKLFCFPNSYIFF